MPREFTSLAACISQIQKDVKAKQRAIGKAINRTARETGRDLVLHRVPVAFGELRQSIRVIPGPMAADVRVDAPHAVAVELGSRPHWAPLDAILDWVRLRGMQGLTSTGRIRRLSPTAWTGLAAKGGSSVKAMQSAIRVARSLRERGSPTSSPTDAAMQVARAIQIAIAHRGTKGQHYMRDSIPDVMARIDRLVHDALNAE